MASKLDLALDDVIKQNKKNNNNNRKHHQQSRPNQQNRQRSQRSQPSFSQRSSNRPQQFSRFGGSGGIQKRSSGSNINSRLGSTRNNNNNSHQRNSRPAKRNTNQPWTHDLYKEGSSIQSRLGGVRHSQQRRNPSQTTILVENIHYNVTEDDLREVFNLAGTVEKCKIQFDKSGRSTGVAKVTFSETEGAEKAIEKFNNIDLDGQPMKISKPEKSNYNDRKPSSSSRQSRNRTTDDLDAELEAYNSNNNTANDEDTMMLD
ncbi:hypothetical protein BJ944DRAFT_292243 [Cunninghamella echinulata]|nr:hypothetical protein BJ944DRAFT_292243 [Cunninghamella echinulata]